MASEGLNRVMLIGNLGTDPELRFLQSGSAMLRMRLATTERYADKEGTKQERTEWHTVIMWGKRAEALSKHLAKGKTVYIEGRLQTRAWEDKDGNKRSATEIVANELLFIGGDKQQHRTERAAPQRPLPDHDPSTDDFGDDDLPF